MERKKKWGKSKQCQIVPLCVPACAKILESSQTHLSTAKLQEYVDVFLVFKIVREFHHMLVRQGPVQLDLIRNLGRFNNFV